MAGRFGDSHAATAKLRQKDIDACRNKNNGKSKYGYKQHINVDVVYKLICGYVVTPANVHDSTVTEALINLIQEGEPMYADAAYRSREFEKVLRAWKIRSRIIFKRTKDKDLTAYQKRENKKRSRVRARVEHVFGSMQHELGGKFCRRIGYDRASVNVGLQVLLYNMHRFKFLATSDVC